ncbi:MAG: ROK family protein, partial [Jatrophihabitans sp.]
RLVTGARNLAGEIGHLPAVPDGELCACGQHGCVETYASASALPRRYLAATGAQPPAAEGVRAEGVRAEGVRAEGVRAEQVLARAAAGDPVARTVYEQALTALARAMISYVLLLDPALVVIGGGLSLAGDQLLVPLADRIQAGLSWRAAPRLVTARFGADSGRVGAALVGWRGYDAGGLASAG